MKENQSWPTKEFSEKTKKVHFQRILQLFIAQRPNALQSAKCLVNPLIGSSPPANETDANYCTTAMQLWKKHWQGYIFTKIPCAQSCKSLNCMSGVSTKRKFIEVRCSWRPNVYTEICVTNVCDSGSVVARGHWSVLLACDNDRWNTPTNALGATSHITSHNPLCYGDWPLDTFRCKQLLWCTTAPQFDVLAKMVIWK